MSVKAPRERNFRRPKVKPARRRRVRISWPALRRALGLGLLVLALYQGVTFAVTTPLLRVDRIAVRGNVRLSGGEVQALVEDLRGTSILQADLDAFRRRLLESPWVAQAALRRVLPSTIEIVVAERRPIGLCRVGQDLYLMDESGVLIDQFGPRYAEFDLPIVDGLLPPPAGRGRTQGSIDPERVALAARVIAAFARSEGSTGRLSQVDVSDVRNAVVLLDRDTVLLHLGDQRFAERVQAYLELAGTLRERVPAIDYVDLRFEPRVFVRPAGGRRQRVSARREKAPIATRF